MSNLASPSSTPPTIYGPQPPPPKPEQDLEPTTSLPPLSPADYKVYNHLAETMSYFHNHFLQTWTLLSTACTTHTLPASYTPTTFLQTAHRFLLQLTMHHTLEEAHIFPLLGTRMPEFSTPSSPSSSSPLTTSSATSTQQKMISQHAEIHAGIDSLTAYINEVRNGKRKFDLEDMEERMWWGGVLEKHLDEEVGCLGAENMRRYWSREEMGRMPM